MLASGLESNALPPKLFIYIKEGTTVQKEIEIQGCVEIPEGMTADEFADAFIGWIEANGWRFGGGFAEIVDGYYILPDGTRGRSVEED